jgi:hypothetical protein
MTDRETRVDITPEVSAGIEIGVYRLLQDVLE